MVHTPEAVPPGVKMWLSTCSPKQSTPFVMLITPCLEVAKTRDGQVPRESSMPLDERALCSGMGNTQRSRRSEWQFVLGRCQLKM